LGSKVLLEDDRKNSLRYQTSEDFQARQKGANMPSKLYQILAADNTIDSGMDCFKDLEDDEQDVIDSMAAVASASDPEVSSFAVKFIEHMLGIDGIRIEPGQPRVCEKCLADETVSQEKKVLVFSSFSIRPLTISAHPIQNPDAL
jgi:hypothetical protein